MTEEIFSQSNVAETVCSNLTVPDARNYLTAFNLKTVNCPIRVEDEINHRTYFLPGINETTLSTYSAIQQYGIEEAFHQAIINLNFQVVQTILEMGIDLNKDCSNRLSPLMLAVLSGSEKLVSYLCDYFADVNAVGVYQNTALHLAAKNNYPEIVLLLINRGANISARDQGGNTALLYAARYGCDSIISILCDSGSDLQTTNLEGYTAFTLAIRERHNSTIALLKEKGAH